MRKLLVIQFRSGKSLQHEQECILRAGEWNEQEVEFVNTLSSENDVLTGTDLDLYKGVILGGSGQVNISDWSEDKKEKVLKAGPLIKQAIDQDKPLLGICFGHQLISYLLGGTVEADPKQAETGTFEINLNSNGVNTPLFAGLPNKFYATEGHKNSVTRLPTEAVLLAASKNCKVEAYRIKNNIYGVQFHPELDREGMKTRLELFPSYTKGKTIEEILADYQPTPYAKQVITNFVNICQ